MENQNFNPNSIIGNEKKLKETNVTIDTPVSNPEVSENLSIIVENGKKKKSILVISVVAVILLITVSVFGWLILNKGKDVNTNNQNIEQTNDNSKTKDGYLKALELIKSKGNLDLVEIIVSPKDNTKDFNKNNRKIHYTFFGENKVVSVDYDFVSKTAVINGESSMPANIFGEKIPNIMIDFGYEKAEQILSSDSGYKQYQKNLTELMKNCLWEAKKDYQRGWEWQMSCAGGNASKPQRLNYAVGIDSQKITLIKQTGIN